MVCGKWDKETDVVVIGYGGAGAVAAITVSEQDGQVIVLEKASEPGGSTGTSSGGMGIPDHAEKAAQFIQAVGLGSIDGESANVFAETWVGIKDWLEQHGGQLTFLARSARFKFSGYDTFKQTAYIKNDAYETGSGKVLFGFLEQIVRKLPVDVMLGTAAKRLVQDPDTREIVGVIAECEGKEILIKAKKAVIMTCGGFEGNPEMLATYVEGAPVPIYVSGTPYNTGDGIKMVIDVGADLWHMNGVEWARPGMKVAEFPAAFWLSPREWSWINVNRFGSRFRDESDANGHGKTFAEVFRFNAENVEWPNYPWYMIFDEKTRQAGSIILSEKAPGRSPFSTYNISSGLYNPSPDNMREIEKGWIKKADTIAALATETGIDPIGLQGAIAGYNEHCQNGDGLDPDFHRKQSTLQPIDKPPYYSVECAVNVINTQGGPKRNARGQVLNPYGTPISRLYAGGEFGSIWGHLYPGSSNLPECIVSGIIAGRNAMTETPS